MPIFEEKSLGELPDEVIDAASRDIDPAMKWWTLG